MDLFVFKKTTNIVVGLIEGVETVKEEEWWNGGVDSAIFKMLKDVEVIYVGEKNSNEIAKGFIQLDKENKYGNIEYVELTNDLYYRIMFQENTITNDKIKIV